MHTLPRKYMLLAFLILVAALATIVSVVARQPSPVDPLDPPAGTPTPAPADWLTVGRTVRHVSVVPVSLKKVPVHQIALPKPQPPELVKATTDGGCLAIQAVSATTSGTGGSGVPLVQLHMIHYRADGSVLWDRTDAEPIAGYPQSYCIFADGSFAVGLRIQALATATADPRTTGQLVRFAADGKRLWTADSAETPAGALDNLFALADGSLITAGRIDPVPGAVSGEPASPPGPSTDSTASTAQGNILAQRFAADGQRLQQHILSILDAADFRFQTLAGATLSEGAGLVLAWQVIPFESAATGHSVDRISGLTMLDANLTEIRSIRPAAGVLIQQVQAQPGDPGFLAFGSTQVDQATGDSALVPAVFHYDAQGGLDWQYAADEPGAWLPAATRTTDGQYVVGQYRARDDGSETTTLLAFSAQDSSKRELAEVPGRIEQLVPGSSSGFTAVLRQTVRTLPQPPQVSMLWADTEAVVCQFNRKLQLEWRRTIDQYKYAMRSDLIVVTSRDRLLAG